MQQTMRTASSDEELAYKTRRSEKTRHEQKHDQFVSPCGCFLNPKIPPPKKNRHLFQSRKGEDPRIKIWVFPTKGVPPKWMVKIMENPIKMDDLGVPLFLETSITEKLLKMCLSYYSCIVCIMD